MSLWNPTAGRELDSTPLPEVYPTRIVACLNFWNDLAGLQRTVPTWIRYVDHIIAVDGAYSGMNHGLSTDGSRDYLRGLNSTCSIELIDAPDLTQCEKRSLYLQRGQSGDMLFIIDADETVEHAEQLRKIPRCDVGWVRVQSTLYTREYGQPRLIRWMPNLQYLGRHHWIYQDDRLVCTHQYGGTGYAHRPSTITLRNDRRRGRSSTRLDAKRGNHERQSAVEVVLCAHEPTTTMSDLQSGAREALQIITHAYRDDGLAPSRLHTAINRTTPHSSLFFKRRPGPFGVPEQYSSVIHTSLLTRATAEADVLHFHGAMSLSRGAAQKAAIVFHHHGTLYRTNADAYNQQARERGALVLLSNLELFTWTNGQDAHFLPNTIPVARYRALREREQVPFTGSAPFRVAHSPSQPHRKGTAEFLAVCARLASYGIPIEPVLIHGVDHHEALRLKATCHAAFDSFWLGMQCSGIEAAAMGLPVIAGDETVAERYRTSYGYVPYTFAGNEEQLEHELMKIVSDSWYRVEEAMRVSLHVTEVHDESAVALRYLDLLDKHCGWRSAVRSRHHVLRASRTSSFMRPGAR